MSEVVKKAQNARSAARTLALTSANERDTALRAMAAALRSRTPEILRANAMDYSAAQDEGTPGPLLDRLMLDSGRIEGIARALEQLANEPDPIGDVIVGRTLASGLEMKQIRVPLGVVAMVYEARPNVTADAAALAIKTGNAVILRGGSLAANSNIVMTEVLYEAALSAGMPAFCIQSIQNTSREATDELMKLTGMIDVLIPRGGPGLIKTVVENASVPVIETGSGNCHVYVHDAAEPDKAHDITLNAKVQRPGVCNAAETLLIDSAVADALLPRILISLREAGVVVHADEKAAGIAASVGVETLAATEEDWATEYHALEMAVKVVAGLDEAIDHINMYGTHHSDAIVSESVTACRRFTAEVDSSCVYANASTRFTDGGEFGLGAEIGISTQKLHARGPMGLTALTSSKFVLFGDGQIR